MLLATYQLFTSTNLMNHNLNLISVVSQLRMSFSKHVFELVVFCNWFYGWPAATLADQPSKTLYFLLCPRDETNSQRGKKKN